MHSQGAGRGDVLANLSENLKRYRKARGFSQTDLAQGASLSRRMISAIEGGSANVSLSTVDRLAAALSVKFTDLVRPTDAIDSLRIDSVGWRGASQGSEGRLLGAAPGSRETELWIWHLDPGEHYGSEANSHLWHEVLYVFEGTLTLEQGSQKLRLDPGAFHIFSSGDPYLFANEGKAPVVYIRCVVL